MKENGYSDKITVIKGKIEEIDLPFKEGEIDIIVSEWMGYFLLYESMLDCVLWARDKFLNKKTGKMLPDKAQMRMGAMEDWEYITGKNDFWGNVYGVDMSCMTHGVLVDPMVEEVPSSNLLSDSCIILDLDLMTMKPEDVEFSNSYSLTMSYSDTVHALVTWFDVSFSNLTRPTILSTSPMKKQTHWKQNNTPENKINAGKTNRDARKQNQHHHNKSTSRKTRSTPGKQIITTRVHCAGTHMRVTALQLALTSIKTHCPPLDRS